MWVFTKDGFLSAVQNNEDRHRMRVRARRRDHLSNAFPEHDKLIIDLQKSGAQFDYRWHLDIARGEWIDYLTDAALDVDYSSHAKEAMSGSDKKFYSALLEVWSAMYRLQKPDANDDVDEFGWDDDDDEVSDPAE